MQPDIKITDEMIEAAMVVWNKWGTLPPQELVELIYRAMEHKRRDGQS